jgi:hypothetical protein
MALTLHGTVSDNTVALDRKTATPLIINGDMRIAQRATSVTGITDSGYKALDRFTAFLSDNGTWTQSKDTDVPSGYGFSSSMKFDCTTADTSVASGSLHLLRHMVEAQNCQVLKTGTSSAETLTLAFWIKSSVTGTYICEIEKHDAGRSISQAYTISSANTWEKKVLNFPADTTGTITNDNGIGLGVHWCFGAGSDYATGTLQTSWGSMTTNARFTGQVNGASSTDNNILITGVQLEVGTFADDNALPPFQFEDVGTSLARCQRYFLIYGGNSSHERIAQGFMFNTGQARCEIIHPCTMRSSPSVSVSSVGDWSIEGTSVVTVTSVATDQSSPRVSSINFGCSSGPTAGQAIHIMGNNTSNARLKLESEL